MKREIKVIFIDDAQDDIDLAVRQLARAGFTPEWRRVTSGAELAAALSEHAWDIVLCERVTPLYKAIEAWHLLRQRKLDTPFVIFTDLAYNTDMIELLDAGIAHFIDKSRMETLGPAVQRLIGKAGRAARR